MTRVALLAVGLFVGVGEARAALVITFSVDGHGRQANHIVVVDDTGKVLESWRGNLAVGASIPLKDFKIKLEHKVEPQFSKTGAALPKLPATVTGNRLVLFLRKGEPWYWGGSVEAVGGWVGGNWTGGFTTSTVWVEDGLAFS